MTERLIIALLRLAALLLVACGVPLMWRVMMRTTWQVDCVIAAVASIVFAYTCERQEQH